ncbi:MAG: 1-aminocyclopropane-1-carboxylate deaminase/D-cysteine desulfhydrase [Myxococcota bacterium]
MSETRSIPLFTRHPELGSGFDRFPLCELPTPVARLEKLEREAGTGPIWVKRDDLSASPYGGNKARKLEWLLARARSRGATRVLTFGGLGTNHGLATALYAKRLDLRCELVLAHQPVSDAVRKRLLVFHALGARIFYGGSVAGSVRIALGRILRHPRTYVVPVGGSSAHGTLGFVNAGLELAEQVARGELPTPARLYIACGSGGSAAGLALGLALAGLATRVVAVLVTDLLPPSSSSLRRRVGCSLALLRRRGAKVTARDAVVALELETGFVGGGYGMPSEAAERARVQAAALEELVLDPTYSAKALAALLEREQGRQEPLLFWNTYAPYDCPMELPDWKSLPRPFHRFFREAP